MGARNPTIQVRLSSGRAPDARARLFDGLQAFANLGDSAENYQNFAMKWPTFYPVMFREGGPLGKPMGLIPEMHLIVLTYRNYLRYVWISHPEVDRRGLADILLGLKTQMAEPYPQSSTRVGTRGLLSLGAMIDSFIPHDADQWAANPEVVASWELGEFHYSPTNDFQSAFYLLFREKWRARICAQCKRYFIADKPRQRYCSTACYGMAKRKHGLLWWRTKGDARRRERARKTRRRKALGGRKR